MHFTLDLETAPPDTDRLQILRVVKGKAGVGDDVVVHRGESKCQVDVVFKVDGVSCQIGRDHTQCRLCIAFKTAQGPLLSRIHCALERQAGGSLCVRDHGSLNGTFVNNVKLARGATHSLSTGDVIQFGCGARIATGASVPSDAVLIALRIKVMPLNEAAEASGPALPQVVEDSKPADNKVPDDLCVAAPAINEERGEAEVVADVSPNVNQAEPNVSAPSSQVILLKKRQCNVPSNEKQEHQSAKSAVELVASDHASVIDLVCSRMKEEPVYLSRKKAGGKPQTKNRSPAETVAEYMHLFQHPASGTPASRVLSVDTQEPPAIVSPASVREDGAGSTKLRLMQKADSVIVFGESPSQLGQQQRNNNNNGNPLERLRVLEPIDDHLSQHEGNAVFCSQDCVITVAPGAAQAPTGLVSADNVDAPLSHVLIESQRRCSTSSMEKNFDVIGTTSTFESQMQITAPPSIRTTFVLPAPPSVAPTPFKVPVAQPRNSKAAAASKRKSRLLGIIDALTVQQLPADEKFPRPQQERDVRKELLEATEAKLSENPLSSIVNPGVIPSITVRDDLFNLMKPHQVAGLMFVWKLLVSCRALQEGKIQVTGPSWQTAVAENPSTSLAAAMKNANKPQADGLSKPGFLQFLGNLLWSSQKEEGDAAPSNPCVPNEAGITPAGAILAHAMGLGKTLTAISFIFTLWQQPEMASARIVIAVPKSVIFHWIREITGWAHRSHENTVAIFCLSGDSPSEKQGIVDEWLATPRSVLLLSHRLLAAIMLSDTSITQPRSKKRKRTKKGSEEVDRGWVDEIDSASDADSDSSDAEHPNPPAAKYAHIREHILNNTTLLVIDEAHKMHPPTTSLFRAVTTFKSHVLRLALTATPASNASIDPLLTVLRFVQPSLWGRRDLRDDVLLKELRCAMQSCSLRAVASELPAVSYHKVFVNPSEAQGKLFRQLVEAEAQRGVVGPKKMLSFCTKAMMISGHVELVAEWYRTHSSDGDGVADPRADWAKSSLALPTPFEQPEESLAYTSKMYLLVSMLYESLSHHEKVVVFSHSVQTLRIVGALLRHYDMSLWNDFAILDGSLPARTRDEVALKFNSADDPLCVMLVSSRSCGVGTTFVGASRVILYDASWQSSAEAQMIFRVFRYGQRNPHVSIVKVVSLDALEAGILADEQAKRSAFSLGCTAAQLLSVSHGQRSDNVVVQQECCDDVLRALCPLGEMGLIARIETDDPYLQM